MKPPAGDETPEPAFRKVAGELREQIENQTYPPGERVPSSRELQERYGIANMTARNALKVLAAEELIHNEPGKGWFVTHHDAAWYARKTMDDAQAGGAPEKMTSAEFTALNARITELEERIDRVLGSIESFFKAVNAPRQ